MTASEPALALSKTRVCIKNLPPTTAEVDLKDHLRDGSAVSLVINDCKVLRNAKGKSRKVAFVGFRDAEMAAHVIERFNKSFLRASRLLVEPATAKKDEDQQKEALAAREAKESKEVHSKDKSSKKGADPALERKKEEFIALMGGGKKSKFWSNDDNDERSENQKETLTPEAQDDESVKSIGDSSSDDSSSSSSSDEDEMDDVSPMKNFEKKEKSGLSDLDFLKSKQKKVADLDEADASDDKSTSDSSSSSSDNDSSDEEAPSSEKDATAVPDEMDDKENDKVVEENEFDEDEHVDTPEDSNNARLFVRNLPFATTEEELKEYFASIGSVTECHIPVDDQKRNKGFAFVTFSSAYDALEARTHLDKIDFQGRLLHILPARPPPSKANINPDDPNLTWKQKQELARKEKETKSGSAAKGWSASFVRGDAVIDNLADRLGLRKGDVLGVKDGLSSGDAAVRLALGETQIIEENRDYFKSHGIDMEALVSLGEKDTSKRSTSSLLVKNLPYDTQLDELTKLFHFGEAPVQVLLPPSKTIALVEYGHSSDAKRAFRKLAYRRYKHVPIYLEWAPLAAKVDGASEENQSTPNQEVDDKSAKNILDTQQEVEDDAEMAAPITSTIYVKNLSFNTTEEALHEVFEKNVGKVRTVRIPQKVAPGQNGSDEIRSMSMGFGFVELDSHAAVKQALSKLQGKLVDGHALELKVSNKSNAAGAAPPKPKGKNPTKLVVRNVPFQATRTELLKLFGTFGQLRKVRLPKKFDGSHRGFAFVEFVTSKEALTAMSALSRTHLYGRHLVLEWASDDDQEVDKLREKAQRDIDLSAPPKNKKIRFE